MNDYVTLGRSGLQVSRLTLGTMTFGEDWGWGSDVATSHRVLEAFLEAGGRSIDTANAYTNGHSEAIIGEWLASHRGWRDRLVIGTKFFCNLHPGDPNGGGAGRKAVLHQLEDSLRRLRSDHVDIYWLHQWDRTTPPEETLQTLDDLVRAGKVRYVGFSDLPAWVASRMQTTAQLRGLTPAVGFQLEYSLLQRTVESDYLPMCAATGMGAMAWSPLRHGLLSGKYRREDAERPAGDAAEQSRGGALPAPDDRTWAVVDALTQVAVELDASPAAVALAWVASNPAISSTVIGARTEDHLATNLAALELTLTPQQRRLLDDASTPPPTFPAEYVPVLDGLQHAGATVNGVASEVSWQLEASPVRY